MSDSAEFVDSVLALKPPIAVFDCDGTLWSGDAGRDFFYWEIERGIVSPEVAGAARERYRLYETGEVGEETMCGEMVTMHRGIAVDALYRAAEEFFTEVISPRVFSEMRELTHRLAEQGCDVWAVSSTNKWVVATAAAHFGIARDHVLAASVHLENGHATDRLKRVPTGELKAVAIRDVIAKPVHGVFGNTMHDHAMLALAENAFCINPNPDLERAATQKHWTIYWPQATRK